MNRTVLPLTCIWHKASRFGIFLALFRVDVGDGGADGLIEACREHGYR